MYLMNFDLEDHSSNPVMAIITKIKIKLSHLKNIELGVQFTIEVLASGSEKRTFRVYQQDSSFDSASKLVKNFRLDNDMVDYFAAYIEE